MYLDSMKPVKFDSRVPSSFENRNPFPVQPLAESRYPKAKHRILVVLQHIPKEDIRNRRLLSGTHGTATVNMLKMARTYAKASGLSVLSGEAYAVASYNYFKTYDLDNEEREVSTRAEKQRLRKLVEAMDPTCIIAIGNDVAVALTGWDGSDTHNKYAPRYRGRSLPYRHDKAIRVVPVHDYVLSSFSEADEDDDGDDEYGEYSDKDSVARANLLGYASRCAATALTVGHKRPFCYSGYEVNVQYVDTIKKVDKLLDFLMKAKIISVDIEAASLARITNIIQSIQFATSSKRSYFLPLMHKDAPWTAKQLEHIRLRLRELFGRNFDPLSQDYDTYLIGQNFKFDMTPMRQWLGLYAIYWPVWDLQAGEYSLDENIKAAERTGVPQYNLAQIARNYGIYWYDTAAFGKDDRKHIADRKLDQGVLEYGGSDVQIPFAVHELQIAKARAQRFGDHTYDREFRKFCITQMNNLVKIESFMEGRGVLVDAAWLRQLQLANGPIEKLKTELSQQLRASPAAQKANKLIMKAEGIPADSLWGNQKWVLSLTKPQHKQTLFIKVLGLEPLAMTAGGAPQINKAFYKRYKAKVPEVAVFEELAQLDKLTGTYVTKTARYRRDDPDMRKDGRLRPSFGFTDTVTGRSNSYDPNLQQIPSRGKHAGLIKRMFIAPRGSMLIKMDYSAHEIRIWSVISGDQKLGALFQKGRDLRKRWRETEDPKYKDAIETVGDVHKLNCQLFFGTDPKDVTKEQRDSVKALVFGSIYGMGPGTLAKDLGKDKKFVLDLLAMFFKRYNKASDWLDWAKDHVVKHGYVYAPQGRRRNMFGHLYGAGALEAAVRRMGSNSPIQGWAADMGHTAATLFLWHFPRAAEACGFGKITVDDGGINVMVHDSIEGDFAYRLYLLALQVMQWCATRGCMQYYEQHFGTHYTVPLEVEFELGADDSTLLKWDWSESNLTHIVEESVKQQITIHPTLDHKAVRKEMLSLRHNTKARKYLDKHYPILS